MSRIYNEVCSVHASISTINTARYQLQQVRHEARGAVQQDIRLLFQNIYRPGALTPSVVMSLGLGLAVLVTITQIDGNLRRQFLAALPERAPSFYFIDIPTADADRFGAFLKQVAPQSTVEDVPMLRGRIVAARGGKLHGKWGGFMTKPVVLQVASYPAWDQEPLEAAFRMLRYDQAADRAAFLAEHGPQIHAIATTGGHGCSGALIAACPKLELIAVYGVGYDAVDVAAPHSRNSHHLKSPKKNFSGVMRTA